jgi:hypothetical protein
MRLKNVNGRSVYKNVESRRIVWNSKSRSNLQYDVKKLLEKIWGRDVVYEEFPVYGSRLSLDFYNASRDVAIEVQGKQHTEYVPFFHGQNQSAFIDQLRKDSVKDDFCSINGIKLILLMEEERKDITLDFLKKLLSE